MRKHNIGDKERGVALLIALFALLLISAVGLGTVSYTHLTLPTICSV